MVSISVQNSKKLLKHFEQFGDDAILAVEDANITMASKVAEVAKSKSPVNEGTLRNSIQWSKETPLKYNVGTNLPYAPYIEFGTGARVDIPAEFAELAALAKQRGNTGTFEEGLKQIKEWCRKKGIDIKFAYIIFVNLLNNGMYAKPFMYPAYLEGKASYDAEVQKAFKKLIKKYNG